MGKGTNVFRNQNLLKKISHTPTMKIYKKYGIRRYIIQVLQSGLVWTHKWPFRGLSDLHLGNQKVTLKKLDITYSYFGTLVSGGRANFQILMIPSPEFSVFSDRGAQWKSWLFQRFLLKNDKVWTTLPSWKNINSRTERKSQQKPWMKFIVCNKCRIGVTPSYYEI